MQAGRARAAKEMQEVLERPVLLQIQAAAVALEVLEPMRAQRSTEPVAVVETGPFIRSLGRQSTTALVAAGP
jgi:hypothetical protein